MIKGITLLLVTITLLVASAQAQTIHSFMRPMGSLADTKKGTFSSIEAGFSIDLPKSTGGFSGVVGLRYSWRLNEGFFSAGVVDRNRKIEGTDEFEKETIAVLEHTLNDFARDYFATKAKSLRVDRKDFEFLGHKSIEARFTMSESLCVVRVFWIESRAYIAGVLLFGEQQKFEDIALKVLDSLKPMAGESKDAVAARLIAENTPSDLPQTPQIKLQKSDREGDGLKGKVKTVLEESEWLKGKKSGMPREKDSEKFFDADGNLLKEFRYSDTNGLPAEITVYGFVAGKRVSRSQHITFESSPGGILIKEPPSVTKRRDNRYDMQYVSKYNSTGDRIEYVLYDNSGRIWTRTACKPAGKTTSCVMYDSGGKVNLRWSNTVNERGQLAEAIYPNSPLEGWTTKYVYKYEEFDEAGNWITRTMSSITIVAGTEKEDWLTRQYRKITYYP